jgi:hypothetical protein
VPAVRREIVYNRIIPFVASIDSLEPAGGFAEGESCLEYQEAY